MPIITLDNRSLTSKGWGPDISPSNSAGIEVPLGYYSKSITGISPFRFGRVGHVAPGETFTALTDASTRITGLPLNATVDSDGEAFAILSNARVVQWGIADDTVDAHNATAHGAHSSLTGEDILAYKNATDQYILYSFNDATDGDVGRRTKSSGAYDDDWLSTLGTQTNGSALTAGVPHKMTIGPDGVIYITNGQYIASHAPNTTAVNYKALNLGFGFIATSIEVRGIYLVVVGYQATAYITSYSRGESRCWFWDTTNPDSYNFSFDLQDNYVSAVKANGDALVAFTRGRNNTTKAKLFTGSAFETIYESAQIGNAPRHASVELFQNMLHWTPQSGIALYAMDGRAFHLRTFATLDGATAPLDVGMVRNLAAGSLYLGRQTSANAYDIVKINTDGYILNPDYRTAIIPLPYKSNISRITIHFSQFGSGASVLVSLFKNYSAISLGGAADLENRTISYADEGAISAFSWQPQNAKDVNCFLLNLRFNHSAHTDTAAIVRRIEIHYEPTQKV